MHEDALVYPKDEAFLQLRQQHRAVVYQEVRLRPRHSDIAPAETEVHSRFSRNVHLKIPIVSAAMDTITESRMAIAMAKAGGLGIIHRKFTPEEQVKEVERVKLHLNVMIAKPICVQAGDTVEEVLALRSRKHYPFHSFPVLDVNGKVAGVVTHHDFDLCMDQRLPITEVMTPLSQLVLGTSAMSPEEAFALLTNAKKKVLPILNTTGELEGMYVYSDLARMQQNHSDLYNLDSAGHLRVGAAIGTGDAEIQRALQIIAAGGDAIVIDTAHAHSSRVLNTLRELKRQTNTDIVVGNVSEAVAAKALADAGADGIKVGQGPGSICTTRIVAGIGCPQATAVFECSYAVRGSGIPICADGGITESGDIPIAIGLGADSVMIGNLLAATLETPGEVHPTDQGEKKLYRGMGSESAMEESAASRDRYNQGTIKKFVPEGVEMLVFAKGPVEQILLDLVGGLRAGMGYMGTRTVTQLQQVADFWLFSTAGYNESRPHHGQIIDPKSVGMWR